MKQGILTKNVPDPDMSGQEIDEASFRRGRTVSLIRRMIAFCCDFLCAGLIAAVLPVLLLKAVQLSINPCSTREYQAQKF